MVYSNLHDPTKMFKQLLACDHSSSIMVYSVTLPGMDPFKRMANCGDNNQGFKVKSFAHELGLS